MLTDQLSKKEVEGVSSFLRGFLRIQRSSLARSVTRFRSKKSPQKSLKISDFGSSADDFYKKTVKIMELVILVSPPPLLATSIILK